MVLPQPRGNGARQRRLEARGSTAAATLRQLRDVAGRCLSPGAAAASCINAIHARAASAAAYAHRQASCNVGMQRRRSTGRRRDVIAPRWVRPPGTGSIPSRRSAPGASGACAAAAETAGSAAQQRMTQRGTSMPARAAALQQLQQWHRSAQARRRSASALQPKGTSRGVGSFAAGSSRRQRRSRAQNRVGAAMHIAAPRRRASGLKWERAR